MDIPEETTNLMLDVNSTEKKVEEVITTYKIQSNPHFILTFVIAIQFALTVVTSTIFFPYIICSAICMDENDPGRAKIASTLCFTCGISTIIQILFGSRLPMISGPGVVYIIPILAILNLPKWECPELNIPQYSNFTENTFENGAMDFEDKTEIWQSRMREIQGVIIIAGIFEVLFGIFGIGGWIVKHLSPLTLMPTITLIGLALVKISIKSSSKNWFISLSTIFLILLFSQYLRNVKITFPFVKKESEFKKYAIFQILPVLLGISIVWITCWILTTFNIIPPGDPGRTDSSNWILVQSSSWIRIPYPGQWGRPTVTFGPVLAISAAAFTATIKSIFDFIGTAHSAEVHHPPANVINRGIAVKGVANLIAGFLGTGTGMTTYSEYIGIISVTKVASRNVFLTSGIFLMLFGIFGKFGAFFLTIPEPIIGGVFCIIFSTITGVGISNIKGLNLTTQRNIFIMGFSIFFALVVSEWAEENPTSVVIIEGYENLNQCFFILVRTGMFVGGFIGFFLDATLPGKDESISKIYLQDSVKLDPSHLFTGQDLIYDLPFKFKYFKGLK